MSNTEPNSKARIICWLQHVAPSDILQTRQLPLRRSGRRACPAGRSHWSRASVAVWRHLCHRRPSHGPARGAGPLAAPVGRSGRDTRRPHRRTFTRSQGHHRRQHRLHHHRRRRIGRALFCRDARPFFARAVRRSRLSSRRTDGCIVCATGNWAAPTRHVGRSPGGAATKAGWPSQLGAPLQRRTRRRRPPPRPEGGTKPP